MDLGQERNTEERRAPRRVCGWETISEKTDCPSVSQYLPDATEHLRGTAGITEMERRGHGPPDYVLMGLTREGLSPVEGGIENQNTSK